MVFNQTLKRVIVKEEAEAAAEPVRVPLLVDFIKPVCFSSALHLQLAWHVSARASYVVCVLNMNLCL